MRTEWSSFPNEPREAGFFILKGLRKKEGSMIKQMEKMALIMGLSQIALAVTLYYSLKV